MGGFFLRSCELLCSGNHFYFFTSLHYDRSLVCMIFRCLALKCEKPYVQKFFNPVEIFKMLTITYNENLQDN